MRFFLVCVLVQAALVTVRAESQPEVPNALSSDRTGRILASYSQKAAENTAAALVKLDNVTSAIGQVSTEISDLNQLLNQTDAKILGKLDDINNALVDGSDLLVSLDSTSKTLADVLVSLTDPTDETTLPGQLSKLYTLLNDKFLSLEKIIGYDEIPGGARSARVPKRLVKKN